MDLFLQTQQGLFVRCSQTAIAASGGVTRAADIIEQAITTGKPVLAEPTKT
ncbi:MAG: hypothetical protein ACRC6M_00950 [Microcystaceae cyanobacterium]